MAADLFEDVPQVGEGIDSQPLAGCDETGQHGGGPSFVIATQKHPVLPFHRHAACCHQ